MTTHCLTCGEELSVVISRYRRGGGLYCSNKCARAPGTKGRHQKYLEQRATTDPLPLVALTIKGNTAVIVLTRGKYALIDTQDWEMASKYRWTAVRCKGGYFYATRGEWVNGKAGGKCLHLPLHRVLLGPKDGEWVDHRDGKTLDNRRQNLRLATPTQNRWNRRERHRTMAGAYKSYRRWFSRITHNGKDVYLGTFGTEAEAHEAYKQAARRLRGEFSGV